MNNHKKAVPVRCLLERLWLRYWCLWENFKHFA